MVSSYSQFVEIAKGLLRNNFTCFNLERDGYCFKDISIQKETRVIGPAINVGVHIW